MANGASFWDMAFLWPKLLRNSEGRKELLNDIKTGEGYGGLGTPLHGLHAGYEARKLGSAHRLKQSIGRIKDGENPFSRQFINDTADDQLGNVKDFGKANWPVLLGFMSAGSAAGGAAQGGNAAGGSSTAGYTAANPAGWAGYGGSGGSGGLASSGMGLLSKNQQQQAPGQVVVQESDPQAEQAARMRMLQEMQLQQLRQKPNKTLEEWQQLQMLTRNQGLLG